MRFLFLLCSARHLTVAARISPITAAQINYLINLVSNHSIFLWSRQVIPPLSSPTLKSISSKLIMSPSTMAFATPASLSVRSTLFSATSSFCAQSAKSTRSTCVSSRRVKPSVSMHGPGHGHGHGQAATTESSSDTKGRRRPGEHKGFVEEMRMVAMRLHTRDQAPREGKQEQSALPIDAWYPRKEDYMQFLIDSRCVYTYFETELINDKDEIFSRFQNTGLERLESLNVDIEYLNSEFNIPISQPTIAATKYIAYLNTLAKDRKESLLCHWYNYYFAHSAGGKMIGRLMQDRLFDGKQFAFYQWDSDVKECLNEVRVIIDDVAKDWPEKVKEDCLKETSLAFGYSGTVLQNLAKAAQ